MSIPPETELPGRGTIRQHIRELLASAPLNLEHLVLRLGRTYHYPTDEAAIAAVQRELDQMMADGTITVDGGGTYYRPGVTSLSPTPRRRRRSAVPQ